MGALTDPDIGWRTIDWARYCHHQDVEGRRIAYIDIGDGPQTCLLLHGFAASWRWWLRTLTTLAKERRVIAVDLPGFGASEPVPDPSLARIIGRLERLCATLELGTVAVIGHSLGTMLACQLTIRHPHRVASLSLIGGPITSVLGLFRRPLPTLRRHPQVASFLLEALSGPLPLPAPVLRGLAARPVGRRLAMAPYMAKPAALPADLAEQLLAGAGARGALPTLRAGFNPATPASFRGITHPTLLIGGTRDAIAPVADLRSHARHNRVDRLRLLEGTGHTPMIEQPHKVNAELGSFLAYEATR